MLRARGLVSARPALGACPADSAINDSSLLLTIYMLVGIMLYSKIEAWNAIDTIYFLVVSCTTVG